MREGRNGSRGGSCRIVPHGGGRRQRALDTCAAHLPRPQVLGRTPSQCPCGRCGECARTPTGTALARSTSASVPRPHIVPRSHGTCWAFDRPGQRRRIGSKIGSKRWPGGSPRRERPAKNAGPSTPRSARDLRPRKERPAKDAGPAAGSATLHSAQDYASRGC